MEFLLVIGVLIFSAFYYMVQILEAVMPFIIAVIAILVIIYIVYFIYYLITHPEAAVGWAIVGTIVLIICVIATYYDSDLHKNHVKETTAVYVYESGGQFNWIDMHGELLSVPKGTVITLQEGKKVTYVQIYGVQEGRSKHVISLGAYETINELERMYPLRNRLETNVSINDMLEKTFFSRTDITLSDVKEEIEKLEEKHSTKDSSMDLIKKDIVGRTFSDMDAYVITNGADIERTVIDIKNESTLHYIRGIYTAHTGSHSYSWSLNRTIEEGEYSYSVTKSVFGNIKLKFSDKSCKLKVNYDYTVSGIDCY